MVNGDIYIKHFLYVEDIEFLVYISFIIAAIIFLRGLWRFYKRWTYGNQKITINNILPRLANMIKYGLLQRKLVYRPYEGLMHIFLYIGFVVLFVGTLLRALEADIILKIFNVRFLVDGQYLVYKFILNIMGLIAIIGIIMAFIRRLFFKSKFLPDSLSDYLILLDLLVILITGYILDAISTATYRLDWINGWDPIGILLVNYFSTLPNISLLYKIVWIFHMEIAIFSVAFLPYMKLSHILIGGLVNTFFSRLEHASAFKPVENIEEIVDKGELPGAGNLAGLTWKERMDYDACIKCARCTDNCPAANSGKPLSPMDLMLKLRELMDKSQYKDEIVPNHVEPDIIWSCITCGACVYQCPMLIHHVETIIDIRRYLLSKGEDVPEELMQVSYNLMRYGNPTGSNPMERENFINELISEIGIEVAEEGKEYDYIYWMGCQTAYDPVDRDIARALLKILKKAGISVAILPEENCCGEPARRIGDELMFKELVSMNQELLSKYKFKTLIVNCPHGYNIFKYEYPQYGVNINVIHHSQLLAELLENKKIKINKKINLGRVTYHDPCYLGRWNGIYNEPRLVIEESINSKITEMPRSREKSFCCGGGGGHLFFEIKAGERISKIRMEEALSINADVVCVACPYCKIMLNSEVTGDIKVMDIAEVLIKALEE